MFQMTNDGELPLWLWGIWHFFRQHLIA